MLLEPGDTFRHYKVLEKIGEGGMGVVYRARDTRLDRDVALKFLIHAAHSGTEARDRLRREARSLAALDHPNIVSIHDIDAAGDVPFLVLEWVRGKPLTEAPLPLGLQDFLSIALAVADALAAAHDRGIIHRDVKPANVLRTDDGRTKLVDFGLARYFDVDRDGTRTGGLLGTVAYMSPEQVNGLELGPPSDVCSFGVLAFELLTGQRPFRGEGPGAVLGAIANGRHTPIQDVRKDLSAQLSAVVERCLQPDPGARFHNGTELASALRRLLPGRPPATVEATTSLDDRVDRPPLEQEVRYCTTADGIRIAYSTIGSGPVLVRVLGHFTHLEVEWEWPDLRRFWEQLADRHTVVRYDGRGMGLSEPFAGEFTEETRQRDLEAVLTAVGTDRAVLLGISEGGWTAATYVIQHPGQITHLILYGAYRRGALARPGYDPDEDRAVMTLIRKGWGRDTPAFRQLITSQFFRSDADPKLLAHFNELQRVSADPDTAARYLESCHRRGDGRELFQHVNVPTLVLHCREDQAVRAEEGRLLASLIPGAQLVLLPSGTHYFPADPEVVTKSVAAIARFLRA